LGSPCTQFYLVYIRSVLEPKTKVEARRKAREQAQAEAEWKQVTGLAFPRTPEEIEAAIQTLAERQGFPPSLVRKMVADLFAKIETETGIRDVRQVQLQSLNLKPKQTIMYHFDYGDEWRFKVQLDKIIENAPDAEQYPRIVESRGEAPTQYPTEEEMEAAYQEHEAAYRESIRELLEEYSDPAKVASLFQQSKLTDDDKEYITVTLLDLIERHFIPKYGGKDPLDLYSVGMTPYGQHPTLTGYRNGISLPASKTYVNVYPELAKLKYLGSGKFEIFYKEEKSKWQSGAKDVPYSECLRLLETDERFVAALKR
jgi:hypothetical protein